VTTHTFSPDPKYVNDTMALSEHDLRAAIQKRKKMFMIIGLKVAHKAIVYHKWDSKKGIGGKGGGPVGGTIELDIDADVTKNSFMKDKENIDHDFVFEYQLKACIPSDDLYKLHPAHER